MCSPFRNNNCENPPDRFRGLQPSAEDAHRPSKDEITIIRFQVTTTTTMKMKMRTKMMRTPTMKNATTKTVMMKNAMMMKTVTLMMMMPMEIGVYKYQVEEIERILEMIRQRISERKNLYPNMKSTASMISSHCPLLNQLQTEIEKLTV